MAVTVTLDKSLENKVQALAALLDKDVPGTVNMLVERGIRQVSVSMSLPHNGSSGTTQHTHVATERKHGQLADDIRDHVLSNLVNPARERGASEVVVRAGDVHREMGLRNRLPAVCAALGSNIFLRLARVGSSSVAGPANGATTVFTFTLQA